MDETEAVDDAEKAHKPFKYSTEPVDDWMMVAEEHAPYGSKKTDEDSGH